jgi:hypothetical protein
MKNLKYNQLHVISNTLKAGNVFKLDPRLNLIKANDNSVGKSTLVKLIFWALGCDPFFDSTWLNCDAKVILEFEIEGKKYKTHRYKDLMTVVDISNGTTKEYTKITGDYSFFLNEILEFKAKLPNRSTEELESPPPAYYFSPFYIDQKKSWSKAWDNFDKLGQYANWYSTVVNYHIGLLTPKHFEIEEDIYENKKTINILKEYITKLETADEVINNYIPESNASLEEDEFLELTTEIKTELFNLSTKQEDILEKLTLNEGDVAYIVQQISISENILFQLDADYKFAVENIHEDTFECPLCGIEHENSVVNRASILTDKEKAAQQLNELQLELGKLERRRVKFNKTIKEIEVQINAINEKYIVTEKEAKINIPEVIEIMATNSLKNKIEETKEIKIVEESNLITTNKGYKKDQKDILSKEDKETILESFISTLNSYVSILDAEGVNLANITKPTDHSKIVKEGGAAEGTRAILAYYLTIYTLIANHGNEVLSPLVIDTPNQQEQSLKNYDSIIEIITNKMPTNSQIILCAMDNEQLEPFESLAKVIELDENKILIKEMYEEVKIEFEGIKASS